MDNRNYIEYIKFFITIEIEDKVASKELIDRNFYE